MQNGQSNRFAIIPKTVMDGLTVNSIALNVQMPNIFDPRPVTVNYSLDSVADPTANAGGLGYTPGNVNGTVEVPFSEIELLPVGEVPAFILNKTAVKLGITLA